MKLLTSKIIFLLIALQIILNVKTNNTALMGGKSGVDVSKCQPAFSHSEMALRTNGHIFSTLKMISCESQIVAGTNYFFQLKLADGRICHMKVFESLPDKSGKSGYEIQQNESTCLHAEFKAGKNQSEGMLENADNSSPIFRVAWMFASLLVFFVSLF